MEKIIGIYKITSPSKKFYIGKSVNIKSRWNEYKRLACKKQNRLYNSLKKYGVDKHKFEILSQCSEYELNKMEKYYIELYQCFNTEYGLNLREGGDGGRHTEETKRKMSEKAKGRIVSEETKKKLSKSLIGNKHLLGHKHSSETKRKMSLSQKGNHNCLGVRKTEKQKIEISKRLVGNKYALGFKHSNETKAKISKAGKGVRKTQKAIENMKRSWILRKNKIIK